MRRSAIYVFLSQLAIAVTPLLVTPLLTRTIGAEGIGIYSFTYGVASLFVVVGQLGIQLYGRREIARCSDDIESRTRVFWQLSSLLWRVFLVVIVVYLAGVAVLVSDAMTVSAFWIQLLFIVSGMCDVSWLLFGLERFRLASLSTVVARMFVLGGVLLVVRDADDTLAYVWLMALGFLISSAIPWLVVGRYVGRPKIADVTHWGHLRKLRHFLTPALALQFSAIVGVVILGAFGSVLQVGIYDLAFKLGRAPIAFITAIGVVLLPRVTRLMAEGKSEVSQVYLRKGMALTMFLSAGFCFGIIGAADSFIAVYAGPAFADSAVVLQVLAVSLLTIGWGNVLRTQVVLPSGMDAVYSRSLVGGAFVTLCGSAILLSPLGVVGIALAFVIGELWVAVDQAISVRSRVSNGALLFVALRYVACGVATAGIMVYFGGFETWSPIVILVVQVGVGILSYLVLVMLVESGFRDRIVLAEAMRVVRLALRPNRS